MAVTDLTVLDEVTQRLDALRQKASSIRPSESIEPPLPASDFIVANGLSSSDVGSRVHTVAVEVSARRIFQALSETQGANPKFGQIWNLFDILQILGAQDQCESILVWYLIEELLESQSIGGCRVVFDYLESRREKLAKNSKVHLVILRSCNDLLRRLSRADDAVFCGRVFIFLFQCFPLGDRSSVNRVGDYNLDNVTTFDEVPSLHPTSPNVEGSGDPDAMDTSGDVPKPDGHNESKPDDIKLLTTDELYPGFWNMQKSFAHPPHVLRPEVFAGFKRSFEATLAKFKTMPKLLSANSSDASKGVKRDIDSVEREDFMTVLNPKYLTSKELFDLELNDLAFQRHILVQALILVEFLLSFNEKTNRTPSSQKESFSLTEQDFDWALQIKKSIITALRDAPDGPAFARVIDTVLSRDKNWVHWKDENCPPISKMPVDGGEFTSASNAAKSTYSWKNLRATPMSALDLKFLSEQNDANNTGKLFTSSRFILPDTKSLVDKVKEADLDIEFDPDDELLKDTKIRTTWRALRTASHTKLAKFEELDGDQSVGRLTDREDVQITDGDNTEDVDDMGEEDSQPVYEGKPSGTESLELSST